KFGKWVDKKRISQEWIIKNCGVDKNSATRLCGNLDYNPNGSTKGRIVAVLRQHGYDVYIEDFWP
ncbi:MAG: transcriptional regulator, partial [Paenibacillus sp.]|nr:transcriptional regulator [Paenibacillus sp.]